MGKFADICRGDVPRRKGVPFTTLHGVETTCDLVVLDGAQHEQCLADATSAANAAKAPAKDGSPVFDFAIACEVVARAAMDPDKPTERFFATVAEVKAGLDDERIFALYRAQETLQDEHSPRKSRATIEEMMAMLHEHVVTPEGEELPFERFKPVLQRSFVRFLVDLLSISDESKSGSTSSTSSSSESASGTSPRS